MGEYAARKALGLVLFSRLGVLAVLVAANYLVFGKLSNPSAGVIAGVIAADVVLIGLPVAWRVHKHRQHKAFKEARAELKMQRAAAAQ
jgi:hypothetical protein